MGNLTKVVKQESKISRSCRYAEVVATLDAEDKATIGGLWQDGASAWRVTRLLNQAGVAISKDSVYKHRNGGCRCGQVD